MLANCESTSGPFPTYIPDDEQGQYLGVKALLAAGYRQLLCIHLPKGIVATDRRRAGMERACREAGVDPDAMFHHYLPPGERHHIDAAEIAGHYLSGARPMFDAVVCGNDRVAFVIYQVLLGRGCAFRRTSLCWAMTIWWAPASYFCPPAINGTAAAL